MSEAETNPTVAVINDANLVVKCLDCKDAYEVEHVDIYMEPVFGGANPLRSEFTHYIVTFAFNDSVLDEDEETIAYLEDLLCRVDGVWRAQIRGVINSTKAIFAFPCVGLRRQDNDRWTSAGDREGTHFAMRDAKPEEQSGD